MFSPRPEKGAFYKLLNLFFAVLYNDRKLKYHLCFYEYIKNCFKKTNIKNFKKRKYLTAALSGKKRIS